jgi:regulator of protease activity HflC (stomatin/prohibitin superfamily)
MIDLIASLRTVGIMLIALVLSELILRGLGNLFGLYTVVKERECKVFVLFGQVLGVIDEPGLHILPAKIGPAALIVNLLGKTYTLDMRLDQQYLRSQPVNSEEGAPMGIGIWYEMWISDPVAYLFKNTDPRGSLQANVSSSTVRCLSNMPLAEMLETRHQMSQAVRDEVSAKSNEWGYRTGSVYIRKVHFRDLGMIRQIEEKVVNRLRQVTSAIRQAGANQVSVITSSAEREAAVEFARAAAIRPATLRRVLSEFATVPEVNKALFDIIETQRILASGAKLSLLSAGEHNDALTKLLASQPAQPPQPVPMT